MIYIVLVGLSILLSFLLQAVHMILPWLFGPILAAVITSKYFKQHIHWPRILGDIGLYILGAQIGVSFTKEIVKDMQDDMLSIVLMSILIIGAAILISFLFKRIVNCTFETALLSSIPGALNQMVVMAEENKRANLLIVTLAQTSRLLFVIMIVPFIASFAPKGTTEFHSEKVDSMFDVISPGQIIFLMIAMVVMGYIFKRIHFPVPDMLGPIFVLMIWNMTTGLNFQIPYSMIAVAQILFGIRIGLQIYDLSNQITKQLFIGIFVQNSLLIAAAFLIVMLIELMTPHGFNDLFLSAAPGGMAQIVVVGIETKANVAMISSYHIFRIFFILLVVSPLIDFMLKRRSRIDS